MTPNQTIEQHLLLCEELHQLCLEENRFLKQQQRVPEEALQERKRTLMLRLDESIARLRELNISLAGETENKSGIDKTLMEQARSKIMQVLHLDKENEQLLLRFSMGMPPRFQQTPSAPGGTNLQRLYGKR